MTWRLKAACRGLDPDLFTHVHGRYEKSCTTCAEALQVCEGCPVVEECLDEALSRGPGLNQHGIRGGTLAHTRRRMVEVAA